MRLIKRGRLAVYVMLTAGLFGGGLIVAAAEAAAAPPPPPFCWTCQWQYYATCQNVYAKTCTAGEFGTDNCAQGGDCDLGTTWCLTYGDECNFPLAGALDIGPSGSLTRASVGSDVARGDQPRFSRRACDGVVVLRQYAGSERTTLFERTAEIAI